MENASVFWRCGFNKIHTEIQTSNNHYSPFQCSYYMHNVAETNESHTIEEFLVALHRIQRYFRLIFRLK